MMCLNIEETFQTIGNLNISPSGPNMAWYLSLPNLKVSWLRKKKPVRSYTRKFRFIFSKGIAGSCESIMTVVWSLLGCGPLWDRHVHRGCSLPSGASSWNLLWPTALLCSLSCYSSTHTGPLETPGPPPPNPALLSKMPVHLATLFLSAVTVCICFQCLDVSIFPFPLLPCTQSWALNKTDASKASWQCTAVHCAVVGASGEFKVFNSFQSVWCGTESVLCADDANFYQVLSKS